MIFFNIVQEGDIIVQINGESVAGQSIDDISNMIACTQGDLILAVRAGKNSFNERNTADDNALQGRYLWF